MRPIVAVSATLLLAACGGGLPELEPIPVTSADVSSDSAGSLTANGLTQVTLEDGQATGIELDGDTITLTQSGSDGRFVDAEGNTYLLAIGNDGESFALVGVDESLGSFGDFSGGYVEGPGGDLPTGSVTYNGAYDGRLFAGDIYAISGDVQLAAEFDDGSFVARVSDRDFSALNFIEEYAIGQLLDIGDVEDDLTFAGVIDADGTLQGGAASGSPDGSMVGVVYDGGIVGYVEVTQANIMLDIDLLGVGLDGFEIGTFVLTD